MIYSAELSFQGKKTGLSPNPKLTESERQNRIKFGTRNTNSGENVQRFTENVFVWGLFMADYYVQLLLIQAFETNLYIVQNLMRYYQKKLYLCSS
jgi:hypothetical protein